MLGRLELATSSQPWDPDEGTAPFGPEEPYKAGELFMLKVDAQGLRLEPAQAIAGGGMAYVRANAVQSITGGGTADSPDRIPLLLGLQPKKDGDARLHARLFGDDRVLAGKVTEFENDALVLEFKPPGPMTGVARASTITVRLKNEANPPAAPEWKTTTQLGVELAVRNGGTTLFSRSEDGTWQWMNLPSGTPSDGNCLRISHASGAIALDIALAEPDDGGSREPLLGWPVGQFGVRGFLAHVFPAGNAWPETAAGGALFMEVLGRGEKGFLLRHQVAGTKHEVTLDWSTTSTSIIRWPRQPSVDQYLVSSDWGHHTDKVRMVAIPAAPQADLPTHTIDLRLHEQPIPLAALGDTGAGFGITAPWTFLAAAGHHLKSGREALSWHTLDRIEILPALKLAERDDAFEFAPRFRTGTYRDETTDERRIPHPGVARPDIAQSGFVESKMPQGKGFARPVMRGTSVTAFIDDVTDICDPQGFVTQVAWLADTAAGGALEGMVLAQCHPRQQRHWRLSSVDAELAAKKLLLHRQQGELPLSVEATAREVDSAFKSTLQVPAADIASQRPVTQAWFEPFDLANRKPLKIDGLKAEEFLFFPETLLVFDQLWGRGRAALEARTIFAKGDDSGRTVHVRLRGPQEELRTKSQSRPADELRRTNVQILAIDRELVATSTEHLAVADATPGNLLGPDAGTGRGRARIRELIKRVMPAPRVIFVRAELEGQGTAWQLVQMPAPSDDFGARLQVETPQPVPPSAALGWPSHEATEQAGKLGPVGSIDDPVVSPRAGLAGRGSSLRLPAWAPGKDGPKALYVSFASHVAFERPPLVAYTGPAARHLSATPARIRAPLSSATEEALRKLLGLKDAAQISLAAICPPKLERTSIGDRPGELHAWTASVVVPAEEFRFDPDDAGYGRPAATSPVLARQHRAPRSPLLPADEKLSLRRRTYVSDPDRDKTEALAEMKLFGVPATLLRLYEPEGEIRCALEIYSGAVEDFRLADGWNGELRLRLETASKFAAFEPLTRAGLLPAKTSTSTAQVRIGNERFPFKDWAFDQKASILTFAMDSVQALLLLTRLRATNVDVPVAFDFQLAGQASSPAADGTRVALGAVRPAAIRVWPVRNLTIPLQRAAGARATLPVDLQTVAFGDAAYDRQLSAPTFESPPTTLADGTRLVMVTDREEYNLDETVLLVAGIRKVDDEKPTEAAEKDERRAAGLRGDEVRVFLPPAEGQLKLQVDVQPRRRETDPQPPPMRKLRFPDGATSSVRLVPLQPPRAYALHPRSLVEMDGKPAIFEPGDRLVLTVKCMKEGDKEEDPVKSCALMVRLTDLPSISPPPSVYSLVTAPPFVTRASVAVARSSRKRRILRVW